MFSQFRPVKLAAAMLCALALAVLPASAPAATLYTNNYSDQQVAALSIGADGLLTPLAGSPFAVPGFVGGLAIAPDGQRLIAPLYFNDLLAAYSLAPDGAPSPLGTPISAPINQAAPAISPQGRHVYLGGEAGGVVGFVFGADGSLLQLGAAYGSANGEGPAITPDGRFLLMPSYSTESIQRFSVQPDGSLVVLGDTPAGGAGGLHIRITPDGEFAILLSEPGGLGAIRSFAIGADGSLAPVGPSLPTVGALSGFPVLSPNGRFFYNANGNEDSISAYAIDADGGLAAIGAPVASGIGRPDGLAMSVDGRFLYAVPSSGELVQTFAVGADGALTKIGAPVPTGGESDGVGPVVRPAVPTAKLSAQAAAPGSPSSFDGGASSDAGASLTTYSWNFGDGTSATGGDPAVSHSYAKAGVYEVELTVGDDAGCTGFVYTGQSAYCNASGAKATAKLDTLPAISDLKVVHTRFGRKRAAASKARKRKRKPPRPLAFRYVLSEEAGVSFTIERRLNGRRVGKRCKPKTKRNAAKPKCTETRAIGSFGATGKAGTNVTRLPAKLKGRTLGPGAYLATATATDSAGGKSAPSTVRFKIKRPRRR